LMQLVSCMTTSMHKHINVLVKLGS
jgi:hypothetical protein